MMLLLDPGFHDDHSHHYRVNLLLAEAAHAEGLTVLANESLASSELEMPSGLHVVPHFRGNAYVEGMDACADSIFAESSREFRTDCLAAFDRFQARTVLVHTALSYHLLGLAQAVRMSEHLPLALKVSLMFAPPAFLEVANGSRSHGEGLVWGRYSNAIGALLNACDERGVPIHLASSSSDLFDPISEHLGVSIYDHGPVTGVPVRTVGAGRRPRVLAFAGAPKTDRGIDLALASVATGLDMGLDVDWLVQVNEEFPMADQDRHRVGEWVKRLEWHSNVRVLHAPLSPVEYEDLVGSADIAWVLLDPEVYSHKTSGLIWDLLSGGTDKYVAIAGSHPERELHRAGVSVLSLDDPRAIDVARATSLLLHSSGSGRRSRASTAAFVEWATKDVPARERQTRNASPHPEGADGSHRRNDGHPRRGGRSVLVVRSIHRHLAGGSGPTEFVPYLGDHGVTVKVVDLPLDPSQRVDTARVSRSLGAPSSLRWHPDELSLLSELDRFDVVHFVDGEHAGGLVARWPGRARIVTTYHQPASVLEGLITAPQLDRVDVVHAIAPDQASHLAALGNRSVSLVPHGQRERWGTSSARTDKASRLAQPTVLTVGAWLRDPETWFTVAAELAGDGIQFVWLGPPKEALHHPAKPANAYLADTSVSSSDLKAWYASSQVVFLPLKDATANNCLLEARSLGRPIVVTDNAATRYYAGGAVHVPLDAGACVMAIEEVLGQAPDSDFAVSYGNEFKWSHIAERLVNEVYFP